MFSLNRAQIVGNLTRDPEMRYTPNGQAVCSFGVATNRRWKGSDGTLQEATEFHNIVCWRKLAEIVSQILHKGSKVYIEGRLQTRSWEGQDGAKRNRTEIVAENFIALTPKGAEVAVPTEESEIEELPSEGKEEKPAPEVKETKEKKTGKTAKKETEEEVVAKEKEDDEDINLDEIPF